MYDCDDIEHGEQVDHFVVAHQLPIPFAMALTSFIRGAEIHVPDADIPWCQLATYLNRALADYNRETDPSEYRRVYEAAAHSLKNEITLIVERLEQQDRGES